jgi:hypothetical protein
MSSRIGGKGGYSKFPRENQQEATSGSCASSSASHPTSTSSPGPAAWRISRPRPSMPIRGSASGGGLPSRPSRSPATGHRSSRGGRPSSGSRRSTGRQDFPCPGRGSHGSRGSDVHETERVSRVSRTVTPKRPAARGARRCPSPHLRYQRSRRRGERASGAAAARPRFARLDQALPPKRRRTRAGTPSGRIRLAWRSQAPFAGEPNGGTGCHQNPVRVSTIDRLAADAVERSGVRFPYHSAERVEDASRSKLGESTVC